MSPVELNLVKKEEADASIRGIPIEYFMAGGWKSDESHCDR